MSAITRTTILSCRFFQASGGSIIEQVLRTTSLIRNAILNTTNTILFRPPYGEWSPDLGCILNGNLLTSLGHVGPVTWNIPDDNTDADWACWQKGTDPAKCADNYLNNIMKTKKGICLMHDSTADLSQLMKKNLTWQLTQLLVPKLKAAGFQFLRLDADPDISAFANKPLRAALKGSNNKWVSPQKGTGGKILVNGLQPSALQMLRILDLGNCRVALQTPDGFDNIRGEYFSVQNQGVGPVTATANSVGDWETFDVIMVGSEFAFRTFFGSFLTYDPNSLELTSNGAGLQSQQLFGFYNYFSHP